MYAAPTKRRLVHRTRHIQVAPGIVGTDPRDQFRLGSGSASGRRSGPSCLGSHTTPGLVGTAVDRGLECPEAASNPPAAGRPSHLPEVSSAAPARTDEAAKTAARSTSRSKSIGAAAKTAAARWTAGSAHCPSLLVPDWREGTESPPDKSRPAGGHRDPPPQEPTSWRA